MGQIACEQRHRDEEPWDTLTGLLPVWLERKIHLEEERWRGVASQVSTPVLSLSDKRNCMRFSCLSSLLSDGQPEHL